MKRHILHIITGLAVGGAEMALYRLILQFRDSDYDHTVVALTPGGGMSARFAHMGIRVIALDVRHSPFAHSVRLVRLIRTLRPDIVQTWLYHADFLGGLAARVAGNRKVIWGIHTTHLNIGCARTTSLVRRACALMSRWVPHTIVCVADAALRSHARVGYDTRRMTVVANGFDLEALAASEAERSQLRKRCGFGPEDIVIGTLGRFNLDKDHGNFVEAAGKLAAMDDRVRFLMIGRGLDADNPTLARWIRSSGYADRFVLLGERDDVPVCLAAMDIFCLSSRTEAFPIVVGEAMAMGLPCVATDVGDVAALLADTGVVVRKADSDALAHGLSGLIARGPAYMCALGQDARERIRASYSMRRVRARFESIYDCVFDGGRL
jgi:glycosyltransferase involved in cell wall biosynthesis